MSHLLGFLFSPLTRRYRRFKYGRVTTFTYFIPAPPERKTGYREREFDGLVEKLHHLGFEIISLSQESQRGGICVVVMLRALTRQAQELSAQDFPPGQLASFSSANTDQAHAGQSSKEPIEGLYYID